MASAFAPQVLPAGVPLRPTPWKVVQPQLFVTGAGSVKGLLRVAPACRPGPGHPPVSRILHSPAAWAFWDFLSRLGLLPLRAFACVSPSAWHANPPASAFSLLFLLYASALLSLPERGLRSASPRGHRSELCHPLAWDRATSFWTAIPVGTCTLCSRFSGVRTAPPPS